MLGILSGPLWWLAAAMVCLPFAVSVVTKVLDRPAALDEMATGGFPRSQALLLVIVLYQLAAMLLILTRVAPAIGALLLAGFLGAATLIYHQFWRERSAARIAKLNHFAENIALIGALALIALTA